jgi:pyruvate/2-oxoglutarate dehydrogenase complex dihydrolipoamide acyltransferase (E2) component
MPEIDIVWIAAGGGTILVLLLLIVIVTAGGKKKKAQGLKRTQPSPTAAGKAPPSKPASMANNAPATKPAPPASAPTPAKPAAAAPTPTAAPAPAKPAAEPAAPATPLALRYSVDVVRSDSVAGWVHDTAAPGRRLDITVLAGESVVGKAKADGFRKDLQDAGAGDGSCAFNFPLSRKLEKGERIRVVASADKSEQVLVDVAFAGD